MGLLDVMTQVAGLKLVSTLNCPPCLGLQTCQNLIRRSLEEEIECSVELLEEGEPEHRPDETETESPGVVAAQQV